MNEAHCKQCVYFLLTQEEQNLGLCRRYAPKPIFLHAGKKDLPALTRWPQVTTEDWCGEFYQPVPTANCAAG